MCIRDSLVTVHTPNPEPAELDRKNRMFEDVYKRQLGSRSFRNAVQFQIKDERGIGFNRSAGSVLPVSQLGRNVDNPFGADGHRGQRFGKTGDDLERKCHRLALGVVKHGAVQQRALVFHLEHGVRELLFIKLFFAALVHNLVLEAGLRCGDAFFFACLLYTSRCV